MKTLPIARTIFQAAPGVGFAVFLFSSGKTTRNPPGAIAEPNGKRFQLAPPSSEFSEKTEAAIGATPYDRFAFYYFRLQPGVSLAQGASALNNALQLSARGIVLNSLVQDTLDAYKALLPRRISIALVGFDHKQEVA